MKNQMAAYRPNQRPTLWYQGREISRAWLPSSAGRQTNLSICSFTGGGVASDTATTPAIITTWAMNAV